MDKKNNYDTHTHRSVCDRSLMQDIDISNELVRHLVKVAMGYIKYSPGCSFQKDLFRGPAGSGAQEQTPVVPGPPFLVRKSSSVLINQSFVA